MVTNAVLPTVNGAPLIRRLEEAGQKLQDGGSEVVLDFSSVKRLDAGALRAMERLASQADEKSAKVVLSGVNEGVYKVLKVMKLAPRFSFLN